MAEHDPTDQPAVVVSCDTHVGPSLQGQLRAYCPKEHLEAFDAFVAAQDAVRQRAFAGSAEFDEASVLQAHPNLSRPGHHDVYERLRDLDRDGVAAEVIFHFSQNGELFPFMPDFTGGLASSRAEDFELARVGFRIYNRWLADFVSVEPARHVGLAYVPTWDIDAAVAEVEWAREAGLRGVNFPHLDDPVTAATTTRPGSRSGRRASRWRCRSRRTLRALIRSTTRRAPAESRS